MTIEERVSDALTRFGKIVDFSSKKVRRQFFTGLIDAARGDAIEEEREACRKMLIEESKKLSALHDEYLGKGEYERAASIGGFMLVVGDVIEKIEARSLLIT